MDIISGEDLAHPAGTSGNDLLKYTAFNRCQIAQQLNNLKPINDGLALKM